MSTEDSRRNESTATQITFHETAGDCEVSKTTDVWSGPFAETDKYGELTGAEYYRCRDCGREVLEGINKDNVSHRDGCRFGDN